MELKSTVRCCHHCKDRFPACHDVCATYLQAKEEWEEEKARYAEAKRKVKLYEDYKYKQACRELRRKDRLRKNGKL